MTGLMATNMGAAGAARRSCSPFVAFQDALFVKLHFTKEFSYVLVLVLKDRVQIRFGDGQRTLQRGMSCQDSLAVFGLRKIFLSFHVF